MSVVTPNMGLTRWDSITDFFSHAQLAANFAEIDSHNHTTGNGVQIPTGGLQDLAVTSGKIAGSAVTTAKLADNSVTSAKINSKLTSAYRLIHRTTGYLDWPGTGVAGTYVFCEKPVPLTGQELLGEPPPALAFLSADHAVTGLVTKLRLRGALTVGGYGAIGSNITFGLYPVTLSGGYALSLGTLVAGSSVTISSPSATSIQTFANSDFSIPSNGVYVIGCVIPSTPNAPSGFGATVDILVRNV